VFAHYCSQAPPYAYAVITCKIEYSQALKLRSECTPKHHDCAQIALPSNKIALRLHSKTPRLRSDCTPKQQDCAQAALQNTTTALRLHSQAVRLRSDCTPKHHDCAQIALPSNKIALRLHSKTPRLRSDCTPKQQDCAQIALSKYRNCTPTALQMTKMQSQKLKLRSERSLRALLYASREQSDCNPISGCLAGRSERTPSVRL